MIAIKDDFKNEPERQRQEYADMKARTMPKFVAFYLLLIGWCSLMVHSIMIG